MSHINYSTGNFLTPVFLSLLFLDYFQSYLSGGSISVEQRLMEDLLSKIFELTRLAGQAAAELTGRCFTFATVMHHVTKVLEGQDKGHPWVLH